MNATHRVLALVLVLLVSLFNAACGNSSEAGMTGDADTYVGADIDNNDVPRADIAGIDADFETSPPIGGVDVLKIDIQSFDVSIGQEDVDDPWYVDITQTWDSGPDVPAADIPLGSVVLRVRSLDDPNEVQLIDAPIAPEGEDAPERIDLAHFEACAEGGDAPVEALTLTWDGDFYDLRLVTKFDGSEEFAGRFSAGEDQLNFQFGEEAIVPAGECVSFNVWTFTPLPNTGVKWIQPSLAAVSAASYVSVVFEGVVDGKIPARKTVFNPYEGLGIRQQDYDSEEKEVSRLDTNVEAGIFRICAFPDSWGMLSAVNFRIEGLPEGTSFPLSLRVNYIPLHGDWFDLDEASDIVQNGDTFVWIPTRTNPATGVPEDALFWGECFNFRFSLEFVPEDAETFRILIESVETASPIKALNRESWEYEEFLTPLPWTRLLFITPTEGQIPQLEISWMGPSDLSMSEYFMWPGMLTSCEEADSAMCAVLDLRISAINMDGRDSVEIHTATISISATGLPVAGLEIIFETSEGWEEDDLIVQPSVINNGETLIELPERSLDRSNAFEFRVRAFLPAGFPETPFEVLSAPQLTFTLEAVVGTHSYYGNEMEGRIWGPEAAGMWTNWDPRDLPYAGPDYIFHGPEIWLESESSGGLQSVSITQYNAETPGEEIVLLDADVSVPYGPVEVCGFQCLHGTGKFEAPVGTLAIRLGETTFALLDWDQTLATFSAPDGQCEWLDEGEGQRLYAWMSDPLRETTLQAPINLRCFEVAAYAAPISDYQQAGLSPPEVPFVVDFRLDTTSGTTSKVLLDETNPIRGKPTAIVP